MRNKISQREARTLRRRVKQFELNEEQRRARWATAWPGGVNFHSFKIDRESQAAIGTARALGHAVVCVLDGELLKFHAMPPKK